MSSDGGSSGVQQCTMDASGEYALMVLEVPQTGNISHVTIRTGTVTTPQSLDVGLYTVGTDALAGSAYGGMTVGTIASPASNTFYEVALGTAASATRGDLVAIRVDFTSTAGNLQINGGAAAGGQTGYLVCYAGSATKYQYSPTVRFRYSTGAEVYPKMHVFPGIVTQVTFASNSATNIYGNQFTISSPLSIIGLWGHGVNASGGLWKLQLRDATGTVISGSETRNVDTDQSTGQYAAKLQLAAPIILSAGTYYVTMENLQTSPSVGFFYWQHIDAAYLYQSYAVSSNWVYAERTSGGTWSTVPGRVGQVGLIVDKIWSPGGGFAVSQ
jgi:hypothetical protein